MRGSEDILGSSSVYFYFSMINDAKSLIKALGFAIKDEMGEVI